MGSRVIGFRVPDDLAEELERVSDERGQTTAEFLRKLVDDALYPSKGEGKTTLGSSADDGEVTLSDVSGEVELHEENIEEINNKLVKNDGNIGKLTQDVDKRFVATNIETSKLANDLFLRNDDVKQMRKWFNQTIEDCKKIIGDYEKKLGKLHVCPDCGASLHLHRLENSTWHLECVQCGYYSANYKATVWKEKAGRHPIPVKELVGEAK